MECFEDIKASFEKHANPENAIPMAKYMKNKFEFLGLKSPLRRELQKDFLKQAVRLPIAEFSKLIRQLWNEPFREYQYTASELLDKYKKKLPKGYITEFEWLITTKSWWDTVDGIAPRSLGYYFQLYPEMIQTYIPIWTTQENFWLQRAAILFQLKYKQETNTDLLFEVIRQLKDGKEFFVNKAIGWALREYSKTNPKEVSIFVAANKLSPLSRREALKLSPLRKAQLGQTLR